MFDLFLFKGKKARHYRAEHINDDWLKEPYEYGITCHFATPNGVPYAEDYSQNGCHFTLIKTDNKTETDVKKAKRFLRANRDVTGFSVIRPSRIISQAIKGIA